MSLSHGTPPYTEKSNQSWDGTHRNRGYRAKMAQSKESQRRIQVI